AAAPEDMLEPALAAVLEASHASAGALCLFDQRNELLRLAAEVGLSDEGCKRLRQVRRGGMAGWDMPLHSLLNRRVYLIESAAKNRYVPPLVEAAGSLTAAARERERVKAYERERDQLAAAHERAPRVEEGQHAAGERSRAEHEDDLQRALAAARAADQARAAADAEAEGARAALARAEAAV